MSTDLSRFLFQPTKRYSSVRMQQGRVILDSDWNESELIDDEDLRRTLRDVLCAKGTSNNGFAIGNIRTADIQLPDGTTVAGYDFDFGNGSFYLGGLRFESETPSVPETFLTQQDWLQVDASAATLPVRPDNLPAGGSRHDLVYLRGWEQCVTAIEDSELRERALGGPDTSVRVRRMRRVEVLTDVPETCGAAFGQLVQTLGGAITRDYELRSAARLTVGLNPGDLTEDPCKPAVQGGYLGADNQTIRVQLTASDRLIWGYDNASPLYRVQVANIPDPPPGVDGTRRQIKFLTLPRDQAAQPLAGQAVEIIPWGALLPNQEKVAEFQGLLFTVATSFDPEDGTLTLTEAVPQELVQWLADHPQFESGRDEPDRRQYFYLRLWTGGSGDAAAPDFAFTPGTALPLAGTGLSVTFNQPGRAGDFWIIAARPATPDLVVPWELLDSAPPAGPRLFLAPLAIVHWTRGSAGLETSAHDCRERFRPLCDTRGCCTVVVGDGVVSHGDVEAIEDAIAALPADGGEVCLLPGIHRTAAVIANRRNVTIKGCGAATRVIPRPSNTAGIVFHVIDSQRVTLSDMDILTPAGTAIVAEGSKPEALKDLEVAGNRIVAAPAGIQVRQGVDVRIHHNRIRMVDKEGSGFAIQVLVEDGLIERNDAGVVPADRTPPPDGGDGGGNPTDPCADVEVILRAPGLSRFADHIFGVLIDAFPAVPFKALGGIQAAAGCERVKILENTVAGGAGNGILLGGIIPVAPGPIEGPDVTHTIESVGDRIQGVVQREDGASVSGAAVSFTNASGVVRTAVSGSAGFYTVRASPDKYSVTVASPGLEIQAIDASDDQEFGRFHRITLRRAENPKAEDARGFLYEIQIDRNDIAFMGLCGIGHPFVEPGPILGPAVGRAVAVGVTAFGNPVLALGIHRNHIRECFQNEFDAILRAEATQRGFGGISLGYCEDVTISANRVERNGRAAIPACGVFIRLGERMDLHHNHISGNGPLGPRGGAFLEPGIRGGIVAVASSFGTGEAPPSESFDSGRHAARIHENAVAQPAGHAVRLLALGPTSICGNHFTTDVNGPDILERFAGTALVVNMGGAVRLPAGLVLFDDNQSHLGAAARSLTSLVFVTADDLGFGNNQSLSRTAGIRITDTISMFINAFLVGRTLRASDSRFKEPDGGRTAFIASLMTRTSLLNNTSDNHGDHCIFAFNTAPGRPPHVDGNQIVDTALCGVLGNSIAGTVSRFPVDRVVRG